jgi:hypothetical protein
LVAVVLAAIALEPVLRVAFFKSPSMKGHSRPSSSRNPRTRHRGP